MFINKYILLSKQHYSRNCIISIYLFNFNRYIDNISLSLSTYQTLANSKCAHYPAQADIFHILLILYIFYLSHMYIYGKNAWNSTFLGFAVKALPHLIQTFCQTWLGWYFLLAWKLNFFGFRNFVCFPNLCFSLKFRLLQIIGADNPFCKGSDLIVVSG